ncbi:MAG: hypothetical protein Q7S98_05380 [Deltaproteobacteria bacterium]|nr:hypothetical protein [Deltaproteobacteria bacterium]
MPKKKLPKAGSQESYQNVLLEEMKSQIELTLEAVEEGKKQNLELYQSLKSTLKLDISLSQMALTGRIDSVRSEVTELRQKFEKAKDELSAKIDKVGDRLDRHEEEISHLKEASA